MLSVMLPSLLVSDNLHGHMLRQIGPVTPTPAHRIEPQRPHRWQHLVVADASSAHPAHISIPCQLLTFTSASHMQAKPTHV